MRNHVVLVRNRRLESINPLLVKDCVDSDTVELRLDEEFSGLDVVFEIGAQRNIWQGEPMLIAPEVMQAEGDVAMSVHGYSGSERVVTVTCDAAFRVLPSSYSGIDPDDPDRSRYEDLLGQLTQAYEDAQEARDAANKSAEGADQAAGRANESADKADQAAERANTSADAADAATEAAKDATEDALNAAQAAGEKSLYAYADPSADDRIILEYPAFMESEDGGSVYLTLEGSD